MPITVSGTPAVVAATTITLPTHAANDLIVIGAYNGNNTTVPTVPAAGGTVPNYQAVTSTSGNACALILRIAVATGSTHTSGTWGSTHLAVIVLRGADTTNLFWSALGANGGSAAAITAPAVTMGKTDGSSFLTQFFGSNNSSSVGWNGAPAGYTQQVSLSGLAGMCIDSKNLSGSDGAVTNNRLSGTSSHFSAIQVEIAGFGTSRPLLVVTQAVTTAANW